MSSYLINFHPLQTKVRRRKISFSFSSLERVHAHSIDTVERRSHSFCSLLFFAERRPPSFCFFFVCVSFVSFYIAVAQSLPLAVLWEPLSVEIFKFNATEDRPSADIQHKSIGERLTERKAGARTKDGAERKSSLADLYLFYNYIVISDTCFQFHSKLSLASIVFWFRSL